MQNAISMIDRQLQLFSLDKIELHIAALVTIVVAATIFDIRYRRIPNWLVATGTAGALAFHALAPAGSGALFSLSGMALGLAAFLPFYVIGVMGAGDVKLMGMVGVFLGAASTFQAALATLVAGGILAVAVAVRTGVMTQLVLNVRSIVGSTVFGTLNGTAPDPKQMPSIGKMPYALAIAAGTAVQIFFVRG
jgi:prepilin peptidase CpaA